MKKVIEQELFHDIEIQFNDDFNQYEVEQENVVGSFDLIVIEKSKAREVAKAIDPNYQKVIDALNTLVQLKDIKGIPEMAEKYGSMKPKAWEQARQILKELNV